MSASHLKAGAVIAYVLCTVLLFFLRGCWLSRIPAFREEEPK